MRLLIVEDDRELANGLVSVLAQAHYATDLVHGGEAALAACATMTYQLVILDLGLPDRDGIEVLRELRHRHMTSPVLVLTARDALQDRVRGLDAGADDYLVKPFALDELEARVRALLRRGAAPDPSLGFGLLEFDARTRVATVKGQDLALTAREAAVLELLLQRPGRVVSKQQLLDSLYGWGDEVNPSAIEVFVSRLRRKLGEAEAGVGIRALRGLGYRLELLPGEPESHG